MNFSKKKGGKWNLRAECKICEFTYKKQYYKNNKDKISEKDKRYYKNNKEKINERHKKYRDKHKEEKKEYDKKYYQKHKEEKKEYHKQYYQNNRKEILEKCKQYRDGHKEERSEYNKQYYQDNPEIYFNNNNKRRQLEEDRGDGITKDQWLEMMDFFGWRCAYSGEILGDNRSIDHIIPLSLEGEHEIWNCVPMNKSYNSSKYTSDMLEWYTQQDFYSEERLNKIYEWQEYAYKKWGDNK